MCPPPSASGKNLINSYLRRFSISAPYEKTPRAAAAKSDAAAALGALQMGVFLIPVVPNVLDIVALGRFMHKESSKIPLKINRFLCLRCFKVVFFLVWYVTILLDRFSTTDAEANVNSYCGGSFLFMCFSSFSNCTVGVKDPLITAVGCSAVTKAEAGQGRIAPLSRRIS